jgi:hypothetical protein
LKQHTLDPKAATFVAADPIAPPAPLGKAATTRGWRSGEDTGEDLKKRVAWTSEGQIEEVDEEEESAGNILEAPSSES